MNWRKAAPEPVKRTGRSVAVRFGETTAAARALPDFVVVGAQRCGTTTLFRALMSHPQAVRPNLHKGVNYFDLNFFRGWDWYRGHFPTRAAARLKTHGHGRPVVFEASGYYLYHPFAAERLARHLPDVKLVVMLRDPVERAYSAYEHERARGFEWEDFDTALALEDERLVGEHDRMRRDPGYESFTHRHHSYRHRGQYAEQLRRVYQHFPTQRVHVIVSEEFFAAPQAEFARLADFLGLQPHPDVRIEHYNARPREGMREQARQRLTEHFAPYDDDLATLLQRRPAWRL